MTIEGKQALIGKLVIERDLIEKQIRALVAEAQAISPVLDHMAFILRSPLLVPDDLDSSINDVPEPERLREIFASIRKKQGRQSQIEKELADHGLGDQEGN
jgi:hypothetical protein